MKDLIREGRKLQETFKTNVVNEDSFFKFWKKGKKGSFPKTKEEVDGILNSFGIKIYKINADLTVDVRGDVDISNQRSIFYENLTRIPVQFGKVSGHFLCYGNDLKSLEGAPKKVGGDFYCHTNNLISLEGGPETVNGKFHCSNNNLKSLKGAPKTVVFDFDCSHNYLIDLDGAPEIVRGNFDCSNNNLKSLRDAPKQVDGVFKCYNNPLPDSEKEWAKKNIKAKNFKFK